MKGVFYLNDQGIVAFSENCRFLAEPKFFAWEELQDFEDWLVDSPKKMRFTVIFDLVDEDISIDPYPRLYLWEKASVQKGVTERLKAEGADFVNTQWTGITQTNPEGRAEEFMMTASIVAPSHLMQFFSALEQFEVTLEAIQSAPFLLAQYAERYLKKELGLNNKEFERPYFIISRHGKTSYRQTFFNEGKLRISRLIEIDVDEMDPHGVQSALIHEAKLARNYIYNQSLIKDQHSIGYIFLDSDELNLFELEKRVLSEGLIISEDEMQNTLFHAMTLGSIDFKRTLCGLRDSKAYYASSMLAEFVINHSIAPFYSNEYAARMRFSIGAQRTLIAANSLLAIALLSYASVMGINTYLSQYKLELLDQQIKNHIAEKERLQKEVDLQIDAKEIKASVDFSEAILGLKQERTVGFKVKPISDVFAKHEHTQLVKVEWKQKDRLDSHTFEVEVDGWVFPYKDYFKEPVAWVDALVEDLKNVPSLQDVQLTLEPLNRNLKQAVTIDMESMEKAEVIALPFKIKMRVHDGKSK
ncbi:hypothetical protein QCB44_07640 [Thiomicrorhabdus sp. zzn3]|uniref:hypothetical protein n=1 Tax=Thiomicrorhabdus sp. zzn3 TaxID=3039775 RepID=UPI0024366EA9|nr:hypothetical protein [Thiomicrorhabdus sp. zzn3]MDG6778573.1 hypothetical protein [Thiomicrorhabdus sp. zzn3]